MEISFEKGKVTVSESVFDIQKSNTVRKREKGKNIISFPDDYVIIDIETTGLSTDWDSIIEVAALKVHNGEIINEYSSFVEYNDDLPEFITNLTGITNEMLVGAPSPQIVMKELSDFIGSDIIIGYNINFDINFLYDYFEEHLKSKLNNDYVDCMRMARKLYPENKHHRLKDMVDLFNIKVDTEHRALDDCKATKFVYDNIHTNIISKFNDEDKFIKLFAKTSKNLNAKDITTTKTNFDETHPLYGKKCVFTGTLEKMVRQEAMQLVVDFGGEVQNKVTKETNYLILGNNDYCASIKGGKSNKQKKAEQLMLKGQDISVIPENVFYDMITSPLDYSELKNANTTSFGCCSRYKECSDAKKCVHPDEDRSKYCQYRKNLESGKIFY